jgi:hypothetical protein
MNRRGIALLLCFLDHPIQTSQYLISFTLKERTLKRTDLDEFVQCFHAENRMPDPDVLALEIAEELEAALEQFAAIAEDLKR